MTLLNTNVDSLLNKLSHLFPVSEHKHAKNAFHSLVATLYDDRVLKKCYIWEGLYTILSVKPSASFNSTPTTSDIRIVMNMVVEHLYEVMLKDERLIFNIEVIARGQLFAIAQTLLEKIKP